MFHLYKKRTKGKLQWFVEKCKNSRSLGNQMAGWCYEKLNSVNTPMNITCLGVRWVVKCWGSCSSFVLYILNGLTFVHLFSIRNTFPLSIIHIYILPIPNSPLNTLLFFQPMVPKANRGSVNRNSLLAYWLLQIGVLKKQGRCNLPDLKTSIIFFNVTMQVVRKHQWKKMGLSFEG